MNQNPSEEAEPLTERDIEIVTLLATGKYTQVEAAEKLGISRTTLQSSVRKPASRAFMRDLRLEVADAMANATIAESRNAVTVITTLMNAGESEAVKLRAALGIAKLALDNVAALDLREDISAVKESLREQKEQREAPAWGQPAEVNDARDVFMKCVAKVVKARPEYAKYRERVELFLHAAGAEREHIREGIWKRALDGMDHPYCHYVARAIEDTVKDLGQWVMSDADLEYARVELWKQLLEPHGRLPGAPGFTTSTDDGDAPLIR